MNTTPGPDFTSTRWSLVNKAGHGSDEERFAAMSKLCEIYQKPLLRFVQRRFSEFGEDINDVLSIFLANVAHGHFIEGADPKKGRFRNYILGALQKHCISERRKLSAAKRGGSVSHEPLGVAGDDHPALEIADIAFEPDEQVVADMDAVTRARVVARLRASVGGDARSEDICLHFLSTRGLYDGAAPSREDILKCHSMSGSALSNHLRRLGTRLLQTARDEVAGLVPDDEVENELRRIFGIEGPL